MSRAESSVNNSLDFLSKYIPSLDQISAVEKTNPIGFGIFYRNFRDGINVKKIEGALWLGRGG
jgi:hypothetical protein